MTDLKRTLQRELNVQSLPNDEVPDQGRDSPKQHFHQPASNKRDLEVAAHLTNGHNSYATSSGDERPSLPTASSSAKAAHKHSLYTNAAESISTADLSEFMGGNFRTKKHHTSKSTGVLKYQRDFNFDYLRHVVLKFMLSRESESVHLIKAVAVLLDFTKDEQKLLHDTLEYKMSWFGTRPKLGEGQFSKFVPPTY